ncbi:alpha/beta hydrolase family protein [Paenibacillus doosanensis]|uniref:dienelactone hydrolase family protein n=1 Tax=Paenibacillus doosanensis TaxID=1229154 RepID=UPI00217F4E96|nr:alpha/beta hydrolase family protein [Paenibacillus doosanensis]MCS7459759.1 alpha/beta hydrolase family protein [Paenibacillus doosanensis]
MWSPDEFLNDLYDSQALNGQASKLKPWEQRKHEVRERLLQSLGRFPAMPEALNPVLLERQEKDGYTLERIAYTTFERLRMPAYLLIPHGIAQPAPAVIAWHGHGYGSREIVGLQPDGAGEEGNPGLTGHFALQLVRRGLVVMAPEIIGFGDRRLAAERSKDPRKASSCHALASRLLMYGRTAAGLRVLEAIRSLDYLLGRSEVDAARIGTMGFSGGGMIAAFSAALDERIGAAVLSAYASTFRGSLLAMNHCIDNYLPSILPYADLPELIGLIAPRSLFVESGTEDPLFPCESVKAALSALEGIYAAEGAGERLGSDLFPGKHEVSGRRSYEWLASALRA